MANVLLGIHCVVPGCNSTLRKVNQWKTRPCPNPKHKGKLHAHCMCPEPYQFFKFPKQIKLQKIWLERIHRPDLEVNNLTRICSLHFVEGRPTRKNYFPNANLKTILHVNDRHHGEDVSDVKQDAEEEDVPEDVVNRLASRGTVSLIPMELLQEQGDEVDEDDAQEELTISNRGYEDEDENFQAPTNTVTITRVSSISPVRGKVQASNLRFSGTSLASQHIHGNVKKAIQDQGEVFSSNGNSRSSCGIMTAQKSSPGKFTSSSNLLFPMRTGSVINDDNAKYADDSDNSDYLIMEDDDQDVDGDSSELSDIGIDIQPGNHTRVRTATSIAPVVQNKIQKPIPVFATTSNVGGNEFQPIITRVEALPATSKNHLSTSSPTSNEDHKGIVNTTQGNTINRKNSVCTSSRPTASTEATVQRNGEDPDVEMVYSNVQQKPSPLATYDPTKQQLQIANPIKYIQECHNRIAQLLEEKQKLQNQNNELEETIEKLQQDNNSLRHEIVLTAQNKAARKGSPPGMPVNLVPVSATLAKQPVVMTSNSGRRTIRYVIRRPASVAKINTIINSNQ